MRSIVTLLTTALWACTKPTAEPPVDDTAGPVATDETDPSTDDTEPAVETDAPEPLNPVYLGPEQICASPADSRRFMPLEGGSAWDARPFDPSAGSLFVGGGLGAADFTGDGRLDLMVTADELGFRFWVQQADGTLTDRTADLPAIPHDSTGVTPVDLDGDGDLDAAVTTFRDGYFLLRNDGLGRFDDATAALGAPVPADRRWMSSSWADLDQDGDLDGFIAAYGALGGGQGLPLGDASLLLQRGATGFTDLVEGRETDDSLKTGHTFAGAFVDLDDDRLPELYLVNDFGFRWPSQALWNEGGTLVTRAAVGAEQRRENMGLGIGDLNEDGTPDLLVAAWSQLGLFTSSGGQWFNVAPSLGLTLAPARGQHVAWGAELGDLDNDGDLDAAVALGFLDVNSGNPTADDQPDAIFLQADDGTFSDAAQTLGLDHPGWTRAILLVDWNRDGFLDVLRTDLRGPTAILLNPCSDAAWTRVRLEQPGPNPFAIGARVRVQGPERTWTADVRAGGTSYGSAGPPEVHVGLGALERVDLEVTWPDGTVIAYPGVPTRRDVRIVRP